MVVNDKAKITVLCVDDHPIVREGLSSIVNLQNDMTMVGSAESGGEAILLFQQLHPDVTVVDLRLRDMTGFEVIRQILALEPSAHTIALTSFEGDADIESALASGAQGYVVKGMVREELLQAIRSVYSGKRHIPASIAAKIIDHLGAEKLTVRETAVLREIATGKRNKEIGAKLLISEETVKMHVKNILMKLGVNDRTEAVTIALRRGILHL